jgi:hypothetical protein
MYKANIKFRELKSVLMLCFCVGVFFYVFNQHVPEKRQKINSEKHHEYILPYNNPGIAENYKIKIPRQMLCSCPSSELNKTISLDKKTIRPVTVREKSFLQIKTLLKQRNFNLYFASGFHEPPLTA